MEMICSTGFYDASFRARPVPRSEHRNLERRHRTSGTPFSRQQLRCTVGDKAGRTFEKRAFSAGPRGRKGTSCKTKRRIWQRQDDQEEIDDAEENKDEDEDEDDVQDADNDDDDEDVDDGDDAGCSLLAKQPDNGPWTSSWLGNGCSLLRTDISPWMLSSQNGSDHGRHHGRAKNALFSERISRPWT